MMLLLQKLLPWVGVFGCKVASYFCSNDMIEIVYLRSVNLQKPPALGHISSRRLKDMERCCVSAFERCHW